MTSTKLFFTLLCMSLLFANCENKKTEEVSKIVTSSDKMLRHVVLFKFKDGTAAADIEKVETAFKNLPSKIKEIKDFEFGLNNSPENLNQGFTHCFFLSFASEADRAAYLPHPDHKAFGAVLTPYLDKVLVIDYWTGK
jgi:Stress responsive A/B Barrel Domain